MGSEIGVMLIITVETQAANVNFLLDGPLAGAGVDELARSWIARAFERPQHRVSLDLRGVTSIDGAGRQFLARAHRHGNTLVGGVTTKAIVDEIRAISEPDSSSDTTRGWRAISDRLCRCRASNACRCVLRSRVESLLQSGVQECSSICRVSLALTRRASAN